MYQTVIVNLPGVISFELNFSKQFSQQLLNICRLILLLSRGSNTLNVGKVYNINILGQWRSLKNIN